MNLPFPFCRPFAAMVLAVLVWGHAAPVIGADGDAARLIRIARERPPCSNPAGMPIIPNDPGALVTGSGTRCYGTRPTELELWLPQDRYVWLEQQAPNPAAWVTLGPVLVDPRTLEPAPLGLRLTRSDGAWALEARLGQTSTLTRLPPDAWQRLHAPDGQRLWVRLGDDGGHEPRALGSGKVRYRAD